jgi:putative phosphoesterase
MIVGVMSDVHGSLYWFNKTMDNFAECEFIINLGDFLYHGPRNPLPRDYFPKKLSDKAKNIDNLFMIKGNCDSDVDEMVVNKAFMKKSFFFVDGIKILALHGDEVDDYKKLPEIYPYFDIIMFGHIHVPVIEKVDNVILFNPGSVSLPKNNFPNSFGILDTQLKVLKIFDFSKNLIKELFI